METKAFLFFVCLILLLFTSQSQLSSNFSLLPVFILIKKSFLFVDLHASTITNVMFAPDDDKIITTSMDKTTKFFDLKTKKVTIQLE